jgi:hypothetical protein
LAEYPALVSGRDENDQPLLDSTTSYAMDCSDRERERIYTRPVAAELLIDAGATVERKTWTHVIQTGASRMLHLFARKHTLPGTRLARRFKHAEIALPWETFVTFNWRARATAVIYPRSIVGSTMNRVLRRAFMHVQTELMLPACYEVVASCSGAVLRKWAPDSDADANLVVAR